MTDLKLEEWSNQTEGVYIGNNNRESERYPCSVVWTSLPVITWLLPVIGHVGITFSDGTITDFSGPYQITVRNFMGGPPRRVWELETDQMREAAPYDEAVCEGAQRYGKQMHNLVVNNCHTHVASVLNNIQYDGCSKWNQLRLCWAIWTKGKWVNTTMAIKTLLPFALIVVIVVVPVVLTSVFL